LPGGATSQEPTMSHEENAMLELVRELAMFFGKDNLTVAEVTTRVGAVERDPGIPLPIGLVPAPPGLRSAQLGRYPDSGLPYVLILEPAVASRPTVGSLKVAFGQYKRALTGRGHAKELIFPPLASGTRWRVVLVVNVEEGASDLDSARITRITFRRDPIAN